MQRVAEQAKHDKYGFLRFWGLDLGVVREFYYSELFFDVGSQQVHLCTYCSLHCRTMSLGSFY